LWVGAGLTWQLALSTQSVSLFRDQLSAFQLFLSGANFFGDDAHFVFAAIFQVEGNATQLFDFSEQAGKPVDSCQLPVLSLLLGAVRVMGWRMGW